jgi:hypothetical protein
VEIAEMVAIYEKRSAEVFNGNGKAALRAARGAAAASTTLLLPLPGARLGTPMVSRSANLGKREAEWIEIKPKHSANGLEKILQANAAQPRDSFDREEQFAMSDTPGMDAEPKVFVVASSREETSEQFHPHLFRNYEPAKRSEKLSQTGSNAGEVWEVARATSAAPNMFSPIVIDDEQFVDGGLTANNPIELAMKEAQDIWPGRKVGAILSLGCGGQDKSDDAGLWDCLMGDTNKTTVRNTLTAMSTGTYQAHRNVMQDLRAKETDTITINALSEGCIASRAPIVPFPPVEMCKEER